MTEEKYKELCSQEEELMTQLARVKKQIREYKSSATFVKGEYYKHIEDLEYIKFIGNGLYNSYGDEIHCQFMSVSFDETDEENAMIDTCDYGYLNINRYKRISKNEFLQAYNKAIKIVQERIDMELKADNI